MSRSYLSFAVDAVDRLYFALNSAGITTERTLELDREEVDHLVGACDRDTWTLLCDVLLSDVIVDCGRRAYDLCGDEFISMVEQRMSAAACDIAKSLDQPEMLAEIQLMLARAYCHRRDGDRRCDLERAVSCYRQALRGFSRQTCSDMTSTIREEIEHAKRLLADCNLRASDDAHRTRLRVDLAGDA